MGIMNTLLALLELSRPKQWTKNVFVFAAIVFSQKITEVDALVQTGIAFILFCVYSSVVYILNDIVDLERDSQHPDKRKRPLPSGRVSVSIAVGTGIGLFLLATFLSYWLISDRFLMIGLVYIAANIFYSFYGKSIVILDGMLIALGFVLRTIAGAWVIGENPSNWLYICAIFISLFLAFCKRRQEIILLGENNAGNHREILREYSTGLLDQIISIVTAATMVTYSLYCIDSLGIQHQPHVDMRYTIPFVIYGLFRYLYLVYQKDLGGNPSELLLSDSPLLLNGFLWLMVVLWTLYLH